MSRVLVTVDAESRQLVLNVGAEGSAIVLRPMDIVSIGRSEVYYWVAPLPRSSREWGFWRTTPDVAEAAQRMRSEYDPYEPAERRLNRVGSFPLQFAVEERCRVEKEMPDGMVINGQNFLVATSVVSMQNGLVHRQRRSEDPIRRALIEVGCDFEAGSIIHLDDLNAGNLRKGSFSCLFYKEAYSTRTDGQITWSDHDVPGGLARARAQKLERATYAVAVVLHYDCEYERREVTVALSPAANRREVAEAVLGLFRDETRVFSQKWKETLVPSLLDS